MSDDMGLLFLAGLIIIGALVISLCIWIIIATYKKGSLVDNANKFVASLDTAPYEAFVWSMKEFVRLTLSNWSAESKGNSASSSSANMEFKTLYIQTVDKVGIDEIRDRYGTDYKPNWILVTNRTLTPAASEFCNNARILVFDRNIIAANYVYLAKKKHHFLPLNAIPPVTTPPKQNEVPSKTECRHCGYICDGSYEYCPNCYKKLPKRKKHQ